MSNSSDSESEAKISAESDNDSDSIDDDVDDISIIEIELSNALGDGRDGDANAMEVDSGNANATIDGVAENGEEENHSIMRVYHVENTNNETNSMDLSTSTSSKSTSRTQRPKPQKETRLRSTNSDETNFPKSFQFLEKYFKCQSQPVSSTSKKNRRDVKIVAKCNLCNKRISGQLSSASNFKRHYKTKHAVTIEVVAVSGTKAQRQSRKSQQLTLKQTIRPIKTQPALLAAISKFIYSGYHPFSTCEEKQFVRLILGCLGDTGSNLALHVPSRKQVVAQMEKDFEEYQIILKNTFKNTDFLCTTADIWKANHKAYLGMTIHWLDVNCERKWAVLALRRMKNEITYKEVGTLMYSILKEYEIEDKVMQCTTDNGSNFIKAFRIFTETQGSVHNENEDNEVEMVEVEPLLDQFEADKENTIKLPPHFRCASHTLNLIMSKDSKKFVDYEPNTSNGRLEDDFNGEPEDGRLKPGVYTRTSSQTFKKCSIIWNTQSRTTKHADFIHNKLGIYLPTPNDTRWCSFYNALKKILDNEEPMREIGTKLGVKFVHQDFKFLLEYCEIMGYFAKALDKLQGEYKAHFGILLPTLYSLKRRLISLRGRRYVYCHEFLNHMITSLNTRFAVHWAKDEYLIASITHPQFKTLWIKNQYIEKDGEKLIQNILDMCNVHQHAHASTERPPPPINETCRSTRTEDSDLFDFSVIPPIVPSSNKENSEQQQPSEIRGCGFEAFLCDTNDLTILDRYPCIKKLFRQYNVGLPSSAAVERIFSIGGDILSKKRACLTDQHAEIQLMLKTQIS